MKEASTNEIRYSGIDIILPDDDEKRLSTLWDNGQGKTIHARDQNGKWGWFDKEEYARELRKKVFNERERFARISMGRIIRFRNHFNSYPDEHIVNKIDRMEEAIVLLISGPYSFVEDESPSKKEKVVELRTLICLLGTQIERQQKRLVKDIKTAAIEIGNRMKNGGLKRKAQVQICRYYLKKNIIASAPKITAEALSDNVSQHRKQGLF